MKAREIYKIDERELKDVQKQMEELAFSYTPEWKFDKENPDAGSVIGLIFASQMSENIDRFNQVLEKYRMEFSNMYDVKPRAAKSAKTVVVMSAGNVTMSGNVVKKGTQLFGESSEGSRVIFETVHDVFVSNIQLKEVLNVSKEEKKITAANMEVLSNTEESSDVIELFKPKGSTIRNQEIRLYHSYLLDSAKKEIKICISDGGDLTELFSNKEQFSFHYLTENGFLPIEECTVKKDGIVLKWENEPVKVEKKGKNMAAISVHMEQSAGESICIQNAEFVKESLMIADCRISDGRRQLKKEEFCPFHQEISVYDECYICNDELFSQIGATVTMKFQLLFDFYDRNIQPLMQEDLRIIKRKPKYQNQILVSDCFVQEVSFEYFTGKGWQELPCSQEPAGLFGDEKNAGMQHISFVVPEDWQAFEMNDGEFKCIRMQVLRADNCYMPVVRYHYPIIKKLHFTCNYGGKGRKPECIEVICNGQVRDVTEKIYQGEKTEIFEVFPYEDNYVYIGLDKKPIQGPIGIFFDLKDNSSYTGTDLGFEYSTSDGFKNLIIIDGTESFSHSGVIMFEPPTDMHLYSVEGKECFWIRIRDKKDYFTKNQMLRPQLKKIYMNAVEARNMETLPEQEYTIDAVTANMSFSLYAEHILAAEVWVNEKNELTEEQMQKLLLEQPDKVQVEYDLMGEIAEFFVKWEETESFHFTEAMDRVYRIDRMNGRIMFGDGKNAKIPRNTQGVAFRAKVQSCNGMQGNLQVGQITGFLGNVLFVNEVSNPVVAYGGSNIESLAHTLKRGSAILSTHRRLVTEQDYIREVQLYSDDICDVACIIGETRLGKKNEDIMSIVLLMRDYKIGSYSLRNLQEQLKQHLTKQCDMLYGAAEIEIALPVFVEISVDIWIEKSEYQDTFELQQKWLEQVSAYLEPVTSDGRVNWNIGRLPAEREIRRMLSGLEGEVYIKHLSIRANYTDMEGRHEMSLQDVKKTPFMVCTNGEHHIYSVVGGRS